ncbi:MAG: glycosyltransferase [Roseivirga sp.]|nr:glycosyltransferase [Roseivirga sp.]
MAEITIVYVNYHSVEELKRSLKSVTQFTTTAYEVIVINNAPEDDLSALSDYHKDLQIIEPKDNLGFGKACNLGIKASKTPYILLLNPDTYLIEDSISIGLNAYKALNQSVTGVLSCKHMYENGSFQYSCFERSELPVFPFFRIPWKRAVKDSKQYYNDSKAVIDEHSTSHYTYAVHGSFMLGPRQLMEEEPFDEDFFLYSEELDLCRRLQQKQRSAYYLSETTIAHSSHRAVENMAIRNQMYLSSALLVLKYYGKIGYSFYYLQRVLRALFLMASLPLMPRRVAEKIKAHLKDSRPLSGDYLKIFKYSRGLKTHVPLKSSSIE